MEILVLNEYFIMENVGIAKDFVNMNYLTSTWLNSEFIFVNKNLVIKNIGELDYYNKKWLLKEYTKRNPGNWWFYIDIFDKKNELIKIDWNNIVRRYKLLDFEIKTYIANNYYNKISNIYYDKINYLNKNLILKNHDIWLENKRFSWYELYKGKNISNRKTILENIIIASIKNLNKSYIWWLESYRNINYNINTIILPNIKKFNYNLYLYLDYMNWILWKIINDINISLNIEKNYNILLEKIKPYYIKNLLPLEIIIKKYSIFIIKKIKIPFKIWAYWINEWTNHFIIGWNFLLIKKTLLIKNLKTEWTYMDINLLIVLNKIDEKINNIVIIKLINIKDLLIYQNYINFLSLDITSWISKELLKNNINNINLNILSNIINIFLKKNIQYYEVVINNLLLDFYQNLIFISEKPKGNSIIVYEGVTKKKFYLYTILNYLKIDYQITNEFSNNLLEKTDVKNLDKYLQYIFFEKKNIKTEKIYYNLLEDNYEVFWKKLQPIVNRSNIYLTECNFNKINKIKLNNIKYQNVKEVFEIEYFYVYEEKILSYFDKLIRKFLIIKEEEKILTLYELLFKKTSIKYFINYNKKFQYYKVIIYIYLVILNILIYLK